MQPVWASGRVDTVLGWMEWLEDKTSVEQLFGHRRPRGPDPRPPRPPGAAERWAAAAERAASQEPFPDGDATDGLLAFCGPCCAVSGVAQMRRDAQTALERLSPASPHRAAMLHTEGISYLLEGDPDRADPILAHAVDVAVASRCGAVRRSRPRRARPSPPANAATGPRPRRSPKQALTIVRDGHFDDYWTSALVYAWAARIAAHRGDVAQARQHVSQAARLRPLLTYVLPVVSAQALLELGRAYLALGDPSGARAVLRQAQDIFHRRPALGVLPEQAAELRARLGTITTRGTVGASSLTTAELRLLPLLSTHLTLGEISQRLYVSAEHGKDAGHGRLPQVRRLLAHRRHRPHARARPPLPRLAPRIRELGAVVRRRRRADAGRVSRGGTQRSSSAPTVTLGDYASGTQ